jgi:hypothetical protein
MSGQIHDLPRFTSGGKSIPYPLDRRLGGTQSRSRRGGEQKKPITPAGNWTPAVQLVV